MQLTPTKVEVTDESNQRVVKATWEVDGQTVHTSMSGPLDVPEDKFIASMRPSAQRIADTLNAQTPKQVTFGS